MLYTIANVPFETYGTFFSFPSTQNNHPIVVRDVYSDLGKNTKGVLLCICRTLKLPTRDTSGEFKAKADIVAMVKAHLPFAS